MLVVDVFVTDAEDEDLGESELTLRRHYICLKPLLQVVQVLLILNLDPVGLFDGNSESAACTLERFEDIVGGVIVAPTSSSVLVDHDPLLEAELHGLLNRQIAENILVDVDDLVLLQDHWS